MSDLMMRHRHCKTCRTNAKSKCEESIPPGTAALPRPLFPNRATQQHRLTETPGWAGARFSVGVAMLLMALCTILQTAAVGEPLWVDGITEPIHDITMSCPVIGIVADRLVKEGDFVKKGQILIQLDKGLEELAVDRTRLAKEMAQAELGRIKALSERNAISVSQEALEKEQMEFNIASVELELAKEHLQRRLLMAPIDGTITEIFRDVGEACELRQPVARLVDTGRCFFVTNIRASLGHSLEIGQTMKLQVEAGAGSIEMQSTVVFISPVVDPGSGLLRVKLLFDNSERNIHPGAAGRLFIQN